jgi:hypothetical protein
MTFTLMAVVKSNGREIQFRDFRFAKCSFRVKLQKKKFYIFLTHKGPHYYFIQVYSFSPKQYVHCICSSQL